jgi:branched-chain amino acid transport system ATP-binding protein
VLENVMVGTYARTGLLDRAEAENRALEVLDAVGLRQLALRRARELTLPSLKRLEIARALGTRPRMLLLDEVVAGLNPAEVVDAVALIRSLRDRGITILMVEHVMKAIMSLSDRIMVLHYGKKIAEGTPAEISQNEDAINAYLGESHAAAE